MNDERAKDLASKKHMENLLATDPEFRKLTERAASLLANHTPEFKKALVDTMFFGMRVGDGAGKERGAVVIEAEWMGKGDHQAQLSLWRDTGNVHTGPDELMSSKTAKRLDFERAGNPLRFVDVAVGNGKSYTYYVVLEATANGQRYWFNFEKKTHVARFSESFEDYARRRQRRIQNEEALFEAERRQDARKNPPPKPVPPIPPPQLSKTEEALGIAEELLSNAATEKRVYERLNAWFEEQNLPSEDREVMMEEVLRRLGW